MVIKSGGMRKKQLFVKHMLVIQYILTGGNMLEIHHSFDKDKKEIYTAIYLDDHLLIDWTPRFTEINSKHPQVIEAVHKNIYTEE